MKHSAYTLHGQDDECYMVASCKEKLDHIPATVFCSACGWKKDWMFTRPDFELGRRRLDVSATYDGACIVSLRAKQILQECGASDSFFKLIPKEPDYFHLVPVDILRFDIDRRKTRLGKLCETCGLPDTVAGATPPYFRDMFPSDCHILRTDVLFGSYNERHPLIVISTTLAEKMKGAKLSGVDLEPIGVEQFRAP